jgi:glycine betaine/proline transport system ATP-binding protein
MTAIPGPSVVCCNLFKSFGSSGGEVAAVRGASFTVDRGERFVLMGQAGSGKATLLRCLARLCEPTSGRVLIEGVDLLAADPVALVELRRHVMAMALHDPALLPHLDVIGNTAFPLSVQGIGVEECRLRALAALELAGLSGHERHLPAQLSAAQAQRVALARALVVRPRILFLGEPFSTLDRQQRRDLQETLLEVHRRTGVTMVLTTEDFEEALRVATRIAVMKGGEIVEIGTPEELVVRPRTPYVASLGAGFPVAGVLRARTAALPIRVAEVGVTVLGDRTIAEVAELVLASDEPIGVVEDNGRFIGILERQTVLDALLGRGKEREERS